MTIIYNIIGLIGVLLVLGAYVLLQLEKVPPISFSYPFINLIGSLMILLSLFYQWNLPAAIIESAWAIVSICGIWRWRKTKKMPPTPAND